MARNKPLVSEIRKYLVTTVAQAREIVKLWLQAIDLYHVVKLGLPEVDDRYHCWRIPLLKEDRRTRIGEVVVDVYTTEYILVYRKRTDLLIDWHIRNHPDKDVVASSKIGDDYERTNLWRIQPATNSKHPAAFPLELAEKVITYYSFKNDVVLDPFAGSGTVGAAAAKLSRRFVLMETNPDYARRMCKAAVDWLGQSAEDILYINCEPAPQPLRLFN